MGIITDLSQKSLDEQASSQLLQGFNISTSNSEKQALDATVKFATVNAFVRPSIAYTKAWPDSSRVHLFAFNQGNPFPGTFQGKATHTVDALYQFANMRDLMPTQADKDIGDSFGLALVDFAHGKSETIPPFGKDQKVAVWGPDAKPVRVETLKDDPLGLNAEVALIEKLGVMKAWGVMSGYLMA